MLDKASNLNLINDTDEKGGLSCVLSSKTSDGKPKVTGTSIELQRVNPKLCESFFFTNKLIYLHLLSMISSISYGNQL